MTQPVALHAPEWSRIGHGRRRIQPDEGDWPRRPHPCDLDLLGALGGIRTPNLLIRSQMLYPLSYERRV